MLRIIYCKVLDYHEEMEAIFKKCNNILGFQTFSLCLIMLPFHVTSLIRLLKPETSAIFFKTLMDFIVLFMFMTASVIVNIKVIHLYITWEWN